MSTPRRPVLAKIALVAATPVLALCVWYVVAMVLGMTAFDGSPVTADQLWAPATGLVLSGLLIYLGMVLATAGRVSPWNHVAALVAYPVGLLYAAIGVLLLSLGSVALHVALGVILAGAALVLLVVAVTVQVRLVRQRRAGRRA